MLSSLMMSSLLRAGLRPQDGLYLGFAGIVLPFLGFASTNPVWNALCAASVLFFAAASSCFGSSGSAFQDYLQGSGGFDYYEHVKRASLLAAYFALLWQATTGSPGSRTAMHLILQANVFEAGWWALLQEDYVFGVVILGLLLPTTPRVYIARCGTSAAVTARKKMTSYTFRVEAGLDQHAVAREKAKIGTGAGKARSRSRSKNFGSSAVGGRSSSRRRKGMSKVAEQQKSRSGSEGKPLATGAAPAPQPVEKSATGARSRTSLEKLHQQLLGAPEELSISSAEYSLALWNNRLHCAVIGGWHFFGFRWRSQQRNLLPAMSCFMPLVIAEILHLAYFRAKLQKNKVLQQVQNERAGNKELMLKISPVLHPAHVWGVLRVFALITFCIYDTFLDHGMDVRVQTEFFGTEYFALHESAPLERNLVAAGWLLFWGLIFVANKTGRDLSGFTSCESRSSLRSSHR